MKKQITYKQLIAFVNNAHSYLEKNTEETKFTSAIKSVQKQIRKHELIDDYQERMRENNLDHCSIDEKTKAILKEEDGSLKFTVEAQKKVNKLNKDLLSETVEINQRIIDEPGDLTELEKEAFSGIVIIEIIDEE